KALMGELEAGARTFPPSNTKFLFVGHTGCGKSTELSQLANIIETGEGRSQFLSDNFLPIQYSVSEVVGLYNIEFVDIALSIILGIYKEMERLGYVVDESAARRVYDWLYRTQSGSYDPHMATAEVDFDLGLGSLIRLIDVRLKSEGEIREGIRARIRKYVPELINLINQIIYEVSTITGKNILLIIDDLDKIQPLDAALNIFREHVKSLVSFDCFAIYTAPISLLYDAASKHIGQFLEVHYMPMFRVRTKESLPEPPQAPDVTTLREILYRRAHPDLFEDDVIEAAIDMTGGILRELIRLIRSCCVYCEEYGVAQINREVLAYQKSKLKSEYYRILEDEDYQWLHRVKKTKNRASVNVRHLESLCVLYYPNGKGWFDVHPIVSELLQEWEVENADILPTPTTTPLRT
ncbi:MAG: GTPase domain-containing protein, partial [Anaerolineae bacterium]|nr:GTPase domain-containing protein [Anaerolineae bacterium]